MTNFLQRLRRIGKWEWVMILIAAVALTTGLNHVWPVHGGPVRGVVTDSNTNQPLAGVTVIVKWKGSVSGMYRTSYVCYHVALAQTDEHGRFYVPWWWQQTIVGNNRWLHSVWMVTMDRPIEVAAYKPGYFLNPEPYPFGRKDEILLTMEPYAGTIVERLNYLTGLFDRQIKCEADNNTLIPIYRSAYEEGKSIAKTPKELDFVDSLLTGLEAALYGNAIALQRADQRTVKQLQEKKPGR